VLVTASYAAALVFRLNDENKQHFRPDQMVWHDVSSDDHAFVPHGFIFHFYYFEMKTCAYCEKNFISYIVSAVVSHVTVSQ
jgi:hypothetical protein